MAISGKYAVENEKPPKMNAMITIDTSGKEPYGEVFMLGKTMVMKDLKIDEDSFFGICHGSGMNVKISGTVVGDEISGDINAGIIKNKYTGIRKA